MGSLCGTTRRHGRAHVSFDCDDGNAICRVVSGSEARYNRNTSPIVGHPKGEKNESSCLCGKSQSARQH